MSSDVRTAATVSKSRMNLPGFIVCWAAKNNPGELIARPLTHSGLPQKILVLTNEDSIELGCSVQQFGICIPPGAILLSSQNVDASARKTR